MYIYKYIQKRGKRVQKFMAKLIGYKENATILKGNFPGPEKVPRKLAPVNQGFIHTRVCGVIGPQFRDFRRGGRTVGASAQWAPHIGGPIAAH